MNSNISSPYRAALEAHIKQAHKLSRIPLQPSEAFSIIGRKYVQLRNGSDLIAKYDIKARKFV